MSRQRARRASSVSPAELPPFCATPTGIIDERWHRWLELELELTSSLGKAPTVHG